MFTWRRGRIRERLDRAVADGGWTAMHPATVLQHLDFIRSDHCPIMLDTDYQSDLLQRRTGPRRFEAHWLRERGFKEVVEKAWAEAASNTNGVLSKLNQVHAFIHEWDFAVLKQPKKRLRKAQRELQDALNGPMNDESDTKAKEAANLIEILLEQEEVHWAQRSRANWLQHGDRNTSFFHNFASARRKKNFIKKLRDDNNIWFEGTDSLKPHILHYFANLFSSEV
jgi:hypothetical protein